MTFEKEKEIKMYDVKELTSRQYLICKKAFEQGGKIDFNLARIVTDEYAAHALNELERKGFLKRQGPLGMHPYYLTGEGFKAIEKELQADSLWRKKLVG